MTCPEWISVVHEDPKKRDGSSWVIRCDSDRGHRGLCGVAGILVWLPEQTYREVIPIGDDSGRLD